MAAGYLEYDPQYFTSAKSNYTNAAANAMPSAASRDTASARVRSRLGGAYNANNQQLVDQYGPNNQGQLRQAQERARQGYQNSLASGLTDIELGYADKQQEGAKILSGIGDGYSNLGAAQGTVRNAYNTQASNAENDRIKSLNDTLQTFGLYGNAKGHTGPGTPTPREEKFDLELADIIAKLFGAYGS